MKKILVLGLAAFFAFSCAKNNSAIVDVRVDGADSKDILVSQLFINQVKVIDTLKTSKNGAAKCTIKIMDESPNFYYLSYNRKRLASLILKPGDKVSVSVDTLGNNLNISGSEESVLLKEYDSELLSSLSCFDKMSIDLVNAIEDKNEEQAKQLRMDISKTYVKHKQSSIKNIIANPYSFANISLLYQYFTPELPVFAQETDVLIIKRVHDSLVTRYPNSVYIKSLEQQIASFESVNSINNIFSQATEAAFPNITLPDVNAKDVKLQSLEGKPFILFFWSVTDAKQKMFSNELKTIYNKYKSSGFEIYQVCVDVDKTAWATAVKEQNLPWINVCDGLGVQSPAVTLYNVTQIPSLFVFDKNGSMVGKDVFEFAKLDALVSKAVK